MSINNNNNDNNDNNDTIKEGTFYLIVKNDSQDIILEDKTKRGLVVRDTSIDAKLGVVADMGIIHDMDGIGHSVPIRWVFPKINYTLLDVQVHADAIEKRYTDLRKLTCPDD